MTPDFLFSAANLIALAAWLLLGLGVVLNRGGWVKAVGSAVPLVLSALYCVLIVLFFRQAQGGFGSLPDVQQLFTSPWVALAGWVHYLAFDLWIGAWIAQQVMLRGMPRLLLIIFMPLTFLFGPAGLLAHGAAQFLLAPHRREAVA